MCASRETLNTLRSLRAKRECLLCNVAIDKHSAHARHDNVAYADRMLARYDAKK